MNIARRARQILFFLNCIRSFPVYLCYRSSANRKLIQMDLARWMKILNAPLHTAYGLGYQNEFMGMTFFLIHNPEYRNLILNRFAKPPKTAASMIHYAITRMLWKPMDSLFLPTFDIGGGLFIQHGIASVIGPKKMGENCWVNQQVTIGYSGNDLPTFGDNVIINCGAKVIGKVHMGDDSIAGAGAVVVKDVPERAIVGGVPAKVIRIRSDEELAYERQIHYPDADIPEKVK